MLKWEAMLLLPVYIMLAEIENEINGPNSECIGYLNEVLNRANIATLNVNTDSNGNAWTKESLREFIFQERFKELCLEFHEVFDIRRFGRTQWAVENSIDAQNQGVTYEPSMDLYPIPYNETAATD